MNIPSDTSRSSSDRSPWIAAVLVIGFAALYAFTAQRGVSWGDSGLFQRRILDGDLEGNSGLALAHPLFVWSTGFLSNLLPQSARIWFMNAICGVWGALAVGMTYLCARRLARSIPAAILAALTLGCSHMFWWLSTMSEVYTLSVFLLACEAYALLAAVQERRPWLMVAVFLANGFHFSDHNFALLTLPVEIFALGWLVRRSARAAWPAPRVFGLSLAALAAWSVGALPMIVMACTRAKQLGSLGATVLDVLVGSYGAAVVGNMGVPFRVTLFNYALAGMSFILPCWILAARRLFVLGKKKPVEKISPETFFLAAIFLIHFLFWVRYRVADQATFLLPTLFLAVLLAAPAFAAARRPIVWGLATLVLAIGMPCLVSYGLSSCAGQLLKARGQLPFRDDLSYFALPWKHNETSAAQFAVAAAQELPLGALVYVDSVTGGPLACAQRLGILSPDIQLSRDGRSAVPPSSRWEVRPFPRYRISPPEATIVKRGMFYEVILP